VKALIAGLRHLRTVLEQVLHVSDPAVTPMRDLAGVEEHSPGGRRADAVRCPGGVDSARSASAITGLRAKLTRALPPAPRVILALHASDTAVIRPWSRLGTAVRAAFGRRGAVREASGFFASLRGYGVLGGFRSWISS
jgi:hypothetical protein